MRNIVWVWCMLLCMVSCKNADKASASDQEAISKVVHDFFAFYNAELTKDHQFASDFVNSDSVGTSLNEAGLDAFINKMTATGFVGKAWADTERSTFKALAEIWKTQQAGDIPDGMDADRFYCAQDGTPEEFTTAPVTSDIFGNVAKATMTFAAESGNGDSRSFELAKEGDKWVISKFVCGDFALPEASSSAVPTEVVLFMSEKGAVKLAGKAIKAENFDAEVAKLFEGYKKAGATKMPPLKTEIEGTVTMGMRGELETRYREIAETFEK